MKTIVPCLLGSVLLFLVSCEKNGDIRPETGRDLKLTAEEQKKAATDNRFSLDLFQAATADIPDDQNALLSPLSVSMALGMTSNGARGKTLEAIYQALRFEGFSQETVNSYHKKLLTDLPLLDPKTTLNIANSIWYRQGFSVLPEFLDINKNYYQAEVKGLDFNDPKAPGIINAWADAKTQGKIPKVIEQISPEKVMYLINAIYFKGNWEQKFDKAKTEKRLFHQPAGDALETDFMNVEHTFPMLTNQHVQGIELPYGNKKYSMVLLLPAEELTPQDLTRMLREEGTWETWSSQFSVVRTNLWIPKFKFSYENLLNDELSQLGMHIAFTDQADFTGINASGGLLISEVKHKSRS